MTTIRSPLIVNLITKSNAVIGLVNTCIIDLSLIIKLATIERWPDSLWDTQGGCNREVTVIKR